MADVHVLERTNDRVRLALHFPVPSGNNSAGVLWSTALLNSGRGGTILRDGDGTAGTVSTAEKAALMAGTRYEVVEDAKLLSAGTAIAQLNAYLDAYWTKRRVEVLSELQKTLNYFGRTRDVP